MSSNPSSCPTARHLRSTSSPFETTRELMLGAIRTLSPISCPHSWGSDLAKPKCTRTGKQAFDIATLGTDRSMNDCRHRTKVKPAFILSEAGALPRLQAKHRWHRAIKHEGTALLICCITVFHKTTSCPHEIKFLNITHGRIRFSWKMTPSILSYTTGFPAPSL